MFRCVDRSSKQSHRSLLDMKYSFYSLRCSTYLIDYYHHKGIQSAKRFIQAQSIDDLFVFLRIISLIIYWIYWRQKMNNRPISPITNEPFKVENYYFQVLILKLIRKKQEGSHQSTYHFTTVKDYQKFQTSKPIVIVPGSAEYPLQGIKINFVAVSYNPTKPLSFDLRMIESLSDRNKEIGQYIIDANTIIQQFMETQNGAFAFRVDFNDDWAADIELYVDTSRYGVQRLIHQIKNPKPKRADDISIPLQHQKIIAKRKAMDQQAKREEEKFTHHKQFVKFSPKRDRRDESEQKKKEQQLKQRQKKVEKSVVAPVEQKKSPKGAFVPKKQWMIPQAEKYMAKTKNSSKTASLRASQVKQQRQSERQIKPSSRTRAKPIQQPSFLDKLPVQPKYLILAAIIFIAIYLASSFLSNNSAPSTASIEGPSKLGKKSKDTIKENASKKAKTVKAKK